MRWRVRLSTKRRVKPTLRQTSKHTKTGTSMRNPLQEQLLKAGLAKKSKLAAVVREQTKQRHAKGAPDEHVSAGKVDAAQRHTERVERDRLIAAERNAQAKIREAQAQVRQIVEAHALPRTGESPYAFEDAGSIKRLLVDATQRNLLAKGALVIARHGNDYALLPRVAADKVLERDPTSIVLDHRSRDAGTSASQDASQSGRDDEDRFYDQFKVPDDLLW
jgi:uncharacterized protein YaiL (DUF2058 family)